jgi:hypothetical protein
MVIPSFIGESRLSRRDGVNTPLRGAGEGHWERPERHLALKNEIGKAVEHF